MPIRGNEDKSMIGTFISTKKIAIVCLLGLAFMSMACTKAKPEMTLLSEGLLSKSGSAFSVYLEKAASAPVATTNLTLIEYTVVFTEPVNTNTFTEADVSLDAGSTITAVISWSITPTSGDYKTFSLKPISVSGEGTIIPNIDPAGISTTSGKAFEEIYSQNKTIKYDTTQPSVSLSRETLQSSATSSFPIKFSLQFSEPVDPLTLNFNGAVSNQGTLSGVVWTVTNSGNNQDFLVEAISASGSSGTVYPSVGASAAFDLAGLASQWGSASPGEAVTYTFAVIAASIVISDGSLFSYGTVGVGSSLDHTFTLTNTGGSTATSMGGGGLAAPFTFVGGSYPGTGGTCGATLAPAGNCTIIVRFSPAGNGSVSDTIDIAYNDGTATANSTRNIQGVGGSPLVTVDPVFAGFTNWNQYVTAGPTTCAGSETGYYGTLADGCVHAGLARQVVVTGQNSCTNLTITDSLDAFTWNCKVVSTTAVFSIVDFKSGKGLRDLINPTGPAWRSISVEVQLSGAPIASSLPTPWWGDSFMAITSNAAATTLSITAPMIYYISADTTIEALRVTASAGNPSGYPFSIVTLDNSKFIFNGLGAANMNGNFCSTSGATFNTMICLYQQKRVWIEADFNADSGTNKAHSAIYLHSVNFVRVHNSRILNTHPTSTASNYVSISLFGASTGNAFTDNEFYNVNNGITLGSSSAKNLVRNLFAAKISNTGSVGGAGVRLVTSSYNILEGLRISNVNGGTGGSFGVWLSGSHNNVIRNAQISNIHGGSNAEGIGIYSSNSNVITQANISATLSTGIFLASASNNTVSHVTIANTVYNSIFFDSGTCSSNTFNLVLGINSHSSFGGIESAASGGAGNVFVNMASVGNGNPVKIVNAPFTATFSGYLLTHGSPVCSVAGSTNVGTSCTGSFSRPTLSAGSQAAAFVGLLATDDSANPVVGVSPSFSGLTGLDYWLNFQNPFRAWGIYNIATFPGAAHRGACTSGNCGIWDWRVTDSGAFHNRSFDGVTDNSFTSTGTCTSPTDGNSYLNISSPATTFIKYAVEAPWSSAGNSNGLCEANEECIYTPNIGGYQGEGDPRDSGNYCTTLPGATVPNVKMYVYPVTGI